MKRGNATYSITSVFLIILFMLGSTGVVIVKHTCVSCGLSDVHTEIYSNAHSLHSCDCNKESSSSCHKENEDSLHQECCTFSSEKLSLTEYNNSKSVTLSVVILPVLYCNYLSPFDQEEKPSGIAEFHNKHGGRNILQSSCQLII
jgi:hypothetical protein